VDNWETCIRLPFRVQPDANARLPEGQNEWQKELLILDFIPIDKNMIVPLLPFY
jgi:hypothetical protein